MMYCVSLACCVGLGVLKSWVVVGMSFNDIVPCSRWKQKMLVVVDLCVRCLADRINPVHGSAKESLIFECFLQSMA